MWTALFWKDVAERAFFTALQVILGLLTVDGFDLATVDLQAFVVAVVVAVLGVIVKAGIAHPVNGTVSPASLAKDENGTLMNQVEEKMRCGKCQGRTFLDRVFSDNKNFETSCIICGKREFIAKDSELGQWLVKQEADRRIAGSLSQ